MKTNYNPSPKEEKDPATLKRIDSEVLIARAEYGRRLVRIKADRLRVQAEQTRARRTK